MLSPEALSTFRARGVVCVRGLDAADVYADLQAHVIATLREAGCWEGDGFRGPIRDARALVRRLKAHLQKSGALSAALTSNVEAALADLSDGDPFVALSGTSLLLFSAPTNDAWSVPHGTWHLDLPRMPDVDYLGAQVFGFLMPVEAHAGGTLVLEGSHRLCNDEGFLRSREVKERFARAPEMRALFDARHEDRAALVDATFEVAGVELRIRELTGEPGDVWFMDLRVLHAAAPNAGDVPRLMFTERMIRKRAYDALGPEFTGQA